MRGARPALLFSAGLVALAGPLAPEARSDERLDDYVRIALENNASLRAATERWQAAQHAAPQARGLPAPRLTVSQFLEEIQTRTGPQRRRLSYVQPLPGPGKRRLRASVADAEAETLRWRVEEERRRVVRDTKIAYHEYAHLAQEIRLTRESLELLKHLEPVVQRRVQAGDGQEDLLRLLVEIGKLENEVVSAEERQAAASARLDALLGREGGALHAWPSATEPQPIELEAAALRTCMASHPTLERLRQRADVDRRRAELARGEGRPDFSVGLSYLETGDAVLPATVGSGHDPLSVDVSVTLPAWRGQYRAAVEQANVSRLATMSSLEETERRLTAAAERLAYLVEDAAREIRLYRDSLMPRARQALVVTEASYQSGGAGLLDVIDSQRALLGFERAYWRACRDHETRLAEVEALCGALP